MEIEYAILPMAIMIYLIARKIQKRKKYSDARIMLASRLNETSRIEECRKIIRFFETNCGYLLTENISSEELALLVKTGIEPKDLAEYISSKMKDMKGLTIGYQIISGRRFDVKLSQFYRDRHVYIVGSTGCGKTNQIYNMIKQDLDAGKGIGIIACEYDMVRRVFSMMPEHRMDDVIYVNPADLERPVSFNLFHLEQHEAVDAKAAKIYEVVQRNVDDPTSRMKSILLHAFYVMLHVPDTIFTDVTKLLDTRNSREYRHQVVNQVKDEYRRNFWNNVYPNYPSNAYTPLLHRFDQLLNSVYCRNILCQRKNSLNLRQAMDSNKILVFNVSDGLLGEENSNMLGQLFIAAIQIALMSRADIPESKRKKYTLLVDEFHEFLQVKSFEKLLRRTRKYGLGLILSHQNINQLPTNVVEDFLGNVRTISSFGTSFTTASKFSKEFIRKDGPDIVHIPPEYIQYSNTGEAFCKIGNNSFFMQIDRFPIEENEEKIERVIQASRQNYGVIPEKRETYQPDLTNVILNEPERVFN